MLRNRIPKTAAFFGILLAAVLAESAASAQTTISYANPAALNESAIHSTATSTNLTGLTGSYAVGDVIRFTGTTASSNPFGTTALNYYVVFVNGSTICVATTPGGAGLAAVNTTTASTATQGQDWLTGANWTGGIAPNSNTNIASFSGTVSGVAAYVINGNVTNYGFTYDSTLNTDPNLVSGGNGTGLYAWTFATFDGTTPRITLTSSQNRVIFLGNNTAPTMKIALAGNQGLIINSAPGGALTGSGTAATSTAPGKDIRVRFVDWSGFSGGIQVERGDLNINANIATLPSQTMTVGDAQTIANNTLAGLNIGGNSVSVDGLNGNSLGRVYGGTTLTVGAANGSGNYSGVIGVDFPGTTYATSLTKIGTGTQTISGLVKGTGAVTVNGAGGTLILSSANTYSGTTTVTAGKLVVSSAQTGTGAFSVANGATLDVSVSGTSQLSPSTLTLATTATTLEYLNLASTTTAPLKPGTLTLNGTVTVNINSTAIQPGNSYPLVTWTTIGGAGGFVLGSCPFAATLSTNSTTLVLNIPAATTNVWTGVSNGNWDTNTAGNWTGGTGIYADGGVALFNDTATGTTNVTINQALVKPGLALFNNSNLTYSVTSSTGTNIGGSGSVSVSGGGKVTLAGPNTYSGGTTLSAGQLNVNFGGSSSANSAIGTGALTISGGALDNTSSGDVTLAPAIAQNWNGNFAYLGWVHNLNLGGGTVTLGTNCQVAVSNNTLTVGGVIAGAYALTNAGPGTLALTGANSFSGGLFLTTGTVQSGNASALGTGASQLGAGVLDLNGSSLANSNNINSSAFVLTNSSSSPGALVGNSAVNNSFTIGVGSGNVSVARLISTYPTVPYVVTKTGTGTLTFNGAGFNNLMVITVNAGTAVFANTGGSTSDRGVTLNGGIIKLGATGYNSTAPNANLIGDNNPFSINGGTFDLNGWNETVATVNGTNGVILNNATGTARTLTIGGDNGVNTFSGTIQNGSGTLALTMIGSGTQTLSGLNTYTGGTIITNTATLRAGTNNVFPASGDMNVASGTLDLNTFSNTISGLNGAGTVDTEAGGTPTLTVGSNGDGGNFSGSLQNSSGTLSLTKVGVGVQGLSGNNSYSGSTTVSNGTLVVGSSLSGAGVVTVYGPAVLNVTNTSPAIAGAVNLAGSGATLSLLDNAIGTLSLGNGLALTGGNILKFDISSAGLDQIQITAGTFAQAGTATININQVNAPNAGTYPLISGASGISASHFTIGNALSGYTLSLSNDGTTLYLNVALNASPYTYWHNRTNTKWNGGSAGNYNWDASQSGGDVTNPPAPSTDVYFAANGANNFVTTLGADFGVKSLTFNVASSVTIGGTNTLTLGGPVTVNSGAGTNTISVTNVALGADQNISVVDANNTINISSPISGGHAFNVNPSSGSGTVALAGTSSFTGGTTITAGTLALNNPTNTLPDTGAVNINGGTLSIGTNNDTVGAVTLTSGAISGSSGVLKGSSYNVQSGTVAANLGGTAALTMTGSSALLASNSTYSGGTIISSGTLQLGASNALGSGGVTISAGTTLDLNGQTIGNVITYGGVGTLANNGTAPAAVTANANLNNNLTIDTTGSDISVARLIGNTIRTVTKTGPDTLTFNGAGHNNLVDLVVQVGTVICANNGGFSADRGLQISSGATVKLAGPGNGGSYPNSDLINNSEPFDVDGTFDLNGWNETVDTMVDSGGSGVIQNSAAGTNSTLTVGTGGTTAEFNGTIQNGGGLLGLTMGGISNCVQTLSGTCTYSGNTTINAGQLAVTASAASPSSTFVINTNNGLVFHSDTAFLLGGLSGAGNVNMINDGSSAIALAVGSNNLATTYSGILSDGGNGSTLTKVGAGTLTLSGANTYTGLTTVSNGVLVISPNYVAGGNFTVNEGAALGVSGNTPATSAQVGTLSLGVSGLGTSTLLFTSLSVPTNAPITVSTLSPVGGAGSVAISNTVALQVGTYNLVNYSSLTGVGFSAFVLGSLPPGTTAHLVNNTAATPKVIQLAVTAVAPEIWTGAHSTNWDINITANWKLNNVATNYFDLSPVQFDDTVGAAFATVSLVTNVQPSILTVSNNTKSYIFTTSTGSGISGVTGLTKNGSGSLTLVNLTNNFAGGTSISNGALVLAYSTLGTGDILDNGNLVFSNGTPSVSVAVSGSGTLTQNGTNTLELSGTNNTYSGGTIIKSGTVQSDNTNALGTGSVTLGDGVSANSAKLLASPGATFGNGNNITVAAGGSGVYTIQNVNNGDFILGGNIALNNTLTLSTTAGGALFVRGVITSGGANPNLTIDGAGTTTKQVYLYGNNASTFNGNIIVTNKGGLKSSNINALSATNAVYLDSTAFFDNGSLNLTIAGLNDYGVGGATVADAGNGVLLTLGGSGISSFSGVINNQGGIVMNGSGQQTLSGANVYTGPTLVSNGTLVVSGSLASAVTVAGGTLSPGLTGNSSTMIISNTLTVQPAGTLAMNINKTTASQEQIVGLTTITYGGTLVVNNLSGTLTTSDSFRLFSAGTYTGAFATISPAAPAAGLVWNTNTLTTDGTLRVASASAPLSGLKFTAAPGVSGTSLTISATNSGAGTVYLLTTTNLATPVSSWTPIWTNVLTGSGSFTTNLLNAVTPAQNQQYYLLSNTNN